MKSKQERFLELFQPLKERLWHFCLNLEYNRDEAKDLLSETIESAYNAFDDLKSETAFLSYLFTIAYRVYLRQKKAKSKFSDYSSIDWESLIADNIDPIKKAEIAELYSALDKLPIEQRESIVLQEIMGFSQKEICEIQEISLDALKQRLHRAKKKLRDLLSDEPLIFNSSDAQMQENKYE